MISDASGKPILQFIAIQRRDSGEWAIPGVRQVTFDKFCAVVLKILAIYEAQSANTQQIENLRDNFLIDDP